MPGLHLFIGGSLRACQGSSKETKPLWSTHLDEQHVVQAGGGAEGPAAVVVVLVGCYAAC